jgi:hypothetical protein
MEKDLEQLTEMELIIEKIAIKDRINAAMGRDEISKLDKRIGNLLFNKLMRDKRFVTLMANARRGSSPDAWPKMLRYLTKKRQYKTKLATLVPLLLSALNPAGDGIVTKAKRAVRRMRR